MGFGSLQNSGKYGYFIKYVNELAAMVKQAGMTPIAFNDGIEFANKMSASVGSTTYTFDRDIVVCYWSGGWSGYTPRTAANLASDGFRIINTTGDFYYVLGKNDSFDNGYTYAANWSNYKVCGTSLSASSVIGGMFCMWSDYPGAETQTQEAKKIRLPWTAPTQAAWTRPLCPAASTPTAPSTPILPRRATTTVRLPRRLRPARRRAA